MIELFEQNYRGKFALRLVLKNQNETPVSWSIVLPADPQQSLGPSGWKSGIPSRNYEKQDDCPANEIHLVIDSDSAVYVDSGVLSLNLIYEDGRSQSEEFRVRTNLPIWKTTHSVLQEKKNSVNEPTIEPLVTDETKISPQKTDQEAIEPPLVGGPDSIPPKYRRWYSKWRYNRSTKKKYTAIALALVIVTAVIFAALFFRGVSFEKLILLNPTNDENLTTNGEATEPFEEQDTPEQVPEINTETKNADPGNIETESATKLSDLSIGQGDIFWLPDGTFHKISSGNSYDSHNFQRDAAAEIYARTSTEGYLHREAIFQTGLTISFDNSALPYVSKLPEKYVGPLTVGRSMVDGGSLLKSFEHGDGFFNYLSKRWDSDTITIRWSDDREHRVDVPMSAFRLAN